MALVHLDKTVVTFHFKEILEDGSLSNPLTLLGFGALLLGPKLLEPSAPVQSPYRPGIGLTEWVKQRQTFAQRSGAAPARALANAPQEAGRLVA
ncbi:MAG: hypothetical protein MH825_11040 [Cyanobacteria bacterium]|nr:hypothetical protein [Cyanobacteriota bacterium]